MPALDIDEALEVFKAIRAETETGETSLTEQDTRLRIIDRVLVEVLGWPRDEISTEKHSESGYVDYLLASHGRPRLVVEAKKRGNVLVDTKATNAAPYNLGGPALKSALPGINQAQSYCLDYGVELASLTSGHQWIVFRALRSDGVKPKDGKAIVFPSLKAIDDDFAEFWDCLSRDSVIGHLPELRFQEYEGVTLAQRAELTPVIPKDQVELRRKSDLASDLANVYRDYFSALSGDDDLDMLAACFVETKESKEADAQLQKIATNLLNDIKFLDSTGKRLKTEMTTALSRRQGELVLIIGNKGAGKTTFIDRFFRVVLDRSLRERCLVVRVDLADYTGDPEGVARWLTQEVLEKTESSLFPDTPDYNDLQGVLKKHFDRFRKAEFRYLYEANLEGFKQKFGEWMFARRAGDQYEFVKDLLVNAIRNRQLMPCLVYDNADNHSQGVQEAVFQFAVALHRSVKFSFVICPITDRTIWQLSKSGPLQSYDSKSLYLPVPSTKEVLQKRISYLKDMRAPAEREPGQYAARRGMRIEVKSLHAFARILEDVFVKQDYVGRLVGWLSNHDIRRGLLIAERIITSSVIEVDELLKMYLTRDHEPPSRRVINRALLIGDYSHFLQEDSSFVLNLFSQEPERVTSPLTKMSLLRFYIDRSVDADRQGETYADVKTVFSYFTPTRLSRGVIAHHLEDLVSYDLLEPFDPTDRLIHDSQRLRITHAGRIHYQFCFARDEASYLSQIALRTPIRNFETVRRIRAVMAGGKMTWDDWRTLHELFVQYCLAEDATFFRCPSDEMYKSQVDMRERFRETWTQPYSQGM